MRAPYPDAPHPELEAHSIHEAFRENDCHVDDGEEQGTALDRHHAEHMAARHRG
ncbi:hypothetical protein OHS70_02520 [Streptomyces sp. NBC_00390]|uniref:hypothetical protein n=1 Tax=Streptomyces sp. NBC_00390 TaxID=2975736 RepID=UPI002E248967